MISFEMLTVQRNRRKFIIKETIIGTIEVFQLAYKLVQSYLTKSINMNETSFIRKLKKTIWTCANRRVFCMNLGIKVTAYTKNVYLRFNVSIIGVTLC